MTEPEPTPEGTHIQAFVDTSDSPEHNRCRVIIHPLSAAQGVELGEYLMKLASDYMIEKKWAGPAVTHILPTSEAENLQ